MYLSLFRDTRGVLIMCILCRVSLPLTSFTAMDFTAKLTGQLDFDPGSHAGVYVGRAARIDCTSDSTICEAIFSPRLCHSHTLHVYI